MKFITFIICFFVSTTIAFATNITANEKLLLKADSLINCFQSDDAIRLITPLHNALQHTARETDFYSRLTISYIKALENAEQNTLAIDLSLQLLATKQAINQRTELLILMARMHEKVGNYEQCFSYLMKAKPYLQLPLGKTFIPIWEVRMASYYRVATQHKDSALYYAKRAFASSIKYKDEEQLAVSNFLLAFLTDDLQLRKKYFKASLNTWKLQHDVNGMAAMYIGLSKLEIKLGNKKARKQYLDSAKTIIVQNNLLGSKRMIYDALYKYFEDNKQLDSAIFYLKKVDESDIELTQLHNQVELYVRDKKLEANELKQVVAKNGVEINDKNQLIKNQKKAKLQLVLFGITVSALLLIILFFATREFKARKLLQIRKELLQRKNDELETAMQRNKELMKEMNHGVKNNLNILSGLLEIQLSRNENEFVKKELRDSINRINTIADIHKKLYGTNETATLNVKSILSELVVKQLQLMSIDTENQLQSNMNDIQLNVSQIVPLSLIINELITNSCKYALLQANDKIVVTFTQTKNTCTLTVADTGTGFGSDVDIAKLKSMGLYLVQLLTKQLDGKLNWGFVDGLFCVTIDFTIV